VGTRPLLPHVDGLPPVRIDETLAAAPGTVDLWCFFYEGSDESEDLAAYEGLMTSEELERSRRFLFARDRRLFLATRALVRTVLSRYVSVPSQDWRFAVGEHGKPHISHPPCTPRLHFNLSNTPGLIACGVSVAHEHVGVDVEALDRPGQLLDFAEASLSPFEARALRALPASEQQERFLFYWTLKESYIKARGLGLALPLDAFSFLLDEGNDIGIVFEPRLCDDAARWCAISARIRRNKTLFRWRNQ
jgi:4'-phosphopantetheinyl transferase